MVFQGSFKGISIKFENCFKGISTNVQGVGGDLINVPSGVLSWVKGKTSIWLTQCLCFHK